MSSAILNHELINVIFEALSLGVMASDFCAGWVGPGGSVCVREFIPIEQYSRGFTPIFE